ncbi:MAG: chemotaxis protein CheW [Phycisphaeraceae bacterium]|nr:chemotaxis protein CheW [Phycisphaeraceae bacterium]
MSSLAIIWRAGGLLFSTAVGAVVEVLPPVSVNVAPAVPDWVRGLFVYRGALIPLVDVARLLGRESGADKMSNRVLVVRSTLEGAARETGLVGIWVESVLELDRPEFGAAGAHPGFSNEASRFLGPVAQTRFGTVQDVRPADLFTPEQAELLWARVKAGAA